MVTIQVEDELFKVDVNGDIHQPHRTNDNTLQDVRIEAAKMFLLGRHLLTTTQARYWENVKRITPEYDRFRSP